MKENNQTLHPLNFFLNRLLTRTLVLMNLASEENLIHLEFLFVDLTILKGTFFQ